MDVGLRPAARRAYNPKWLLQGQDPALSIDYKQDQAFLMIQQQWLLLFEEIGRTNDL